MLAHRWLHPGTVWHELVFEVHCPARLLLHGLYEMSGMSVVQGRWEAGRIGFQSVQLFGGRSHSPLGSLHNAIILRGAGCSHRLRVFPTPERCSRMRSLCTLMAVAREGRPDLATF